VVRFLQEIFTTETLSLHRDTESASLQLPFSRLLTIGNGKSAIGNVLDSHDVVAAIDVDRFTGNA
jgi:hypothetical protein